MKLSFAEAILFISCTVAAMVTFMHRLRLIARKKINRKAYKRGHFAIAFLMAGMLEVLFCSALRNEIVPLGLNEKGLLLLMLVSGGTIIIGIYNMIWYYVSVGRAKHGEYEIN